MMPDAGQEPDLDPCLGNTSLYRVDPGTVLRSGMLIPFQINQDLCVSPLQGPVPPTLFVTRDATRCPSADSCFVVTYQVLPDLPDPLPRGALVCAFSASLPLTNPNVYLQGSRTVTIFHTSAGFTAHAREEVSGNTFYSGRCTTTYELAPMTP
jgi:hypothetical protein